MSPSLKKSVCGIELIPILELELYCVLISVFICTIYVLIPSLDILDSIVIKGLLSWVILASIMLVPICNALIFDVVLKLTNKGESWTTLF